MSVALGGANGSGGDGGDQPPNPAKWGNNHSHSYRHAPEQIERLEEFFKVCPKPTEETRIALSEYLGMEPKQVKFWFQNRRTQVKNDTVRHKNDVLQQENERLRSTNIALNQTWTERCLSSWQEILRLNVENDRIRREHARMVDIVLQMNQELELFRSHQFPNIPWSSGAAESISVPIVDLGSPTASSSHEFSKHA